MEKVSKPAIWSTRGGLRWSKEGEYEEEKLHYNGIIRESIEKSLYTQEL